MRALLDSINPLTGEIIERYAETTAPDAGAMVDRAARAFEGWRRIPPSGRAEPMLRAAAILEERKSRFAALMAAEMGKPVAQGLAEVEKCAWVCRHFAEQGESMLAPEPVSTDAARSYVAFAPLGVVLAVMPWNFPFWQVFRFAAPALMAGNAVLLKHASNVSGSALAIGEVIRDAGFPEGLFGVLLLRSGAVTPILERPEVKAVTLTGSAEAGRAIAAAAGRLLKKSVLELGGSDPYVILEDAPLEATVETCVAARLVNTGQSCIAAKRFIVVEPVRREFQDRMVSRMRSKKVGDPMDPTVDLGPLARWDLRDALHRQVAESTRRGANAALGGASPAGPGAFYPATVLIDVAPGMPAYQEETFGPVAAIISARDEADAIRIANDSSFGLGAAVFTADAARGERIAAEALDAGTCFVNAQVHSDPRLPFGGIKESGYGRELGRVGLHEFVNVKTVSVR